MGQVPMAMREKWEKYSEADAERKEMSSGTFWHLLAHEIRKPVGTAKTISAKYEVI